MKLVIGSDHAGYRLKKKLLPFLEELGHTIIDVGCDDPKTKPYFPDIARDLCKVILDGDAERGIMFCGTGVGASIACNKIPGIRASLIHDGHSAHQSVEHDHVQVMCIGEKIVGDWLAKDLIDTFLKSEGDTDERAIIVQQKLKELDDRVGL